MANLVMLSDLAIGRKRLIDDELLKLLKSKNLNPAIGYIPSCSDPNRIYFKSTVEYYKAMGINNVSYFDLDMEYDESTDQNFVGITDLSSLGLVNFEFLPHWDGSTDGTELLRKYSKMKDTIIYACRDNDGIIVNNDKVKLMGQIEIIHE